VKLTRRAPGVGELEVYFDPAVAMEEKVVFRNSEVRNPKGKLAEYEERFVLLAMHQTLVERRL